MMTFFFTFFFQLVLLKFWREEEVGSEGVGEWARQRVCCEEGIYIYILNVREKIAC